MGVLLPHQVLPVPISPPLAEDEKLYAIHYPAEAVKLEPGEGGSVIITNLTGAGVPCLVLAVRGAIKEAVDTDWTKLLGTIVGSFGVVKDLLGLGK